jgi:hypothetical protein
VLRQPSPFTNTDTRRSISINRNLTNNLQSNSGGTGIATLLLGYTTGGARGFLLEPHDMTNYEHSPFVQDDWKLSNRLTVNLGLRYDVFVPDTERNNRLLEAAWDITGDAKNVLRTGYGRAFFPIAESASNLLGRQVPYTISQNYSVETNPLVCTPERVPLLSNPFKPIVQVKPMTTEELNAANPRVLGHSFSKETPNMHTWQVSYERQITSTLMGEVVHVGSKGENLTWSFNPNEVQPGPGSQSSRRLIQPLSNLSKMVQCEQTNRSSCHSLQTKLNKRFSRGLQFLASYTFGKSLDYAGSAPGAGS